MRIFAILDKMSLFNKLVVDKKTGSPDEFAKRLGISRTAIYDIISELRSYGVIVKYSRTLNTFYYDNYVSLEVSFKVKHFDCGYSELNYCEMKKVSGGEKIIASVLFSGRKDTIFAIQ